MTSQLLLSPVKPQGDTVTQKSSGSKIKKIGNKVTQKSSYLEILQFEDPADSGVAGLRGVLRKIHTAVFGG